MDENSKAVLVCFLAGILAWTVNAIHKRHQHRIAMRNHKVKIFVDDYLSVDVALSCREPRHPGARLTLFFDGFKVGGNITMYGLQTGQRIIGVITPTQDNGKPGGYEKGSVELINNNQGAQTISRVDEEPDNELKFQIVSNPDFDASAGPVPVSCAVKFDGHSGDGVREVNIPLNGEISERDATTASVQLGAATDYTPPASTEGSENAG